MPRGARRGCSTATWRGAAGAAGGRAPRRRCEKGLLDGNMAWGFSRTGWTDRSIDGFRIPFMKLRWAERPIWRTTPIASSSAQPQADKEPPDFAQFLQKLPARQYSSAARLLRLRRRHDEDHAAVYGTRDVDRRRCPSQPVTVRLARLDAIDGWLRDRNSPWFHSKRRPVEVELHLLG